MVMKIFIELSPGEKCQVKILYRNLFFSEQIKWIRSSIIKIFSKKFTWNEKFSIENLSWCD